MGDVGQLRPPEWRETSQMFELLRSRAGGGAGLEEEQGSRSRAAASSQSEDLNRIFVRTFSAGPPISFPEDQPENRTCGPADLLSIRNGLLFNHLLL